MTDDFRVHPPSEPALISQGWTRRNLADPVRAGEMIELYRSLGYEARAVELTPEDFCSACEGCAPVVCRSHVLVYTRKVREDERDSVP